MARIRCEDHVASDDLEDVLEMSLIEYKSSQSTAGSFRPIHRTSEQPSHLRRQTLNEELAQIDKEIKEYDSEIKKIEELRSLRSADRDRLLRELQQIRAQPGMQLVVERTGKSLKQSGIDYGAPGFDWSRELKARMRNVFGIDDFRLCQEGVCNANMDGRDIVCVMPTGGGKSLTYQLPSLLTAGCTLVISPLIALITDQILHLKEAQIEAVMMTGSTSKAEQRDISARLTALTSQTGGSNNREKEIKLCYVTPEKIAKSKFFKSMLEKMATAGKLARIVIDEAHCVSELGHDFRPDYQKLNILRQLFPRVPIMALSATCPPKVLDDLIKTLRLKPITDGNSAKTEGTVFFTAPLYRKNLRYQVLPKPSSSKTILKTMTEYILQNHANETGIVYCLSKKDATEIAIGLQGISGGKIKTGVYHADVKDQEKEHLHRKWREGTIKVVCATIAFGLGIDKGDVRFVLHHSLSKSLDGFYQESGRAGRDGKYSDCILYYRPQDAARLSAMVCGEKEGENKLRDMLRFAQNLQECRKVQFAKYFSASSRLSVSSWTTDDSDALERCGHCDNCMRPPESVDHKDVTVEAWQILKIVEAVGKSGGRLTLGMTGDLVRGTGSGSLDIGRGRAKEKKDMDLDLIAGGKVTLSKEDTETLLVELLTLDYLQESYHANSFSINVYIILGPQAVRLTRLTRELLKERANPRILCSFRKKQRKAATKGSNAVKAKTHQEGKKRKHQSSNSEGNDADEDDDDDGYIIVEDDIEDDIKDDPDGKWGFNLRSAPPSKRPRWSSTASSSRNQERTVIEDDNEIMVLSSD